MSNTRFYKIWKGLKTRCYNRNYKHYADYGGRGIKVCDRWHKFENFKKDMYVTYKDTLSIDRIDNNRGYCTENCKWATRQEQNRNKRMHKLTKEKVKQIRIEYKNGSYGIGAFLARKYGVCNAVISEIVNYKRNYADI